MRVASPISVKVEEKEEDKGKNFLQKEFTSFSATRGIYLKDASNGGLSPLGTPTVC